MAITTDSYQNIQYSGSTVSQIGLSKTIDNYTWDEIFDYQYCGMCSSLSRIVAPYAANTNITSYDVTKLGFTVEITDSWDGDADFKAEQTGVYNYPQGLYCKIIWLRGTRSDTATYQIYTSNMNDFKLVTEWDAPNFVFTLPSPVSTFGACATSWSDNENDVKTTWHTDTRYGSLAYRYRHDGTYDDISISGNVMPYMLYKHNGHYYCQQLRQTPRYFGATIDKSSSDAKVGVNNLIYPVEDTTVNALSFFGGNVAADGFYYETDRSGTAYNPWDGNYKQTTKKYAYCNLDNDDCMGRFSYAGTGPSQYCGLDTYFRTKHASLLFWAGCGVKFYADKLYKPIISDGFVTDFTDDMTTASDLDNWSGDTKHTIPDAPPAPTPTANGDELTDMLSRGQFYGSGLTKYYVDVPAATLQKALGDWDNIATGKDVLQNLLSYKILCFPSTTFSNGMTEPFVIAGTELKDENDQTITAKKLTSTGAVNLPNIDITPTFNDFRDFAPYTKIQMFVPLCGWFDLPPWCMGRKISGEMYINPYSGTVRCLVRADGNVVAELGGNAAIDLPFNATAVGMKSAAVLSNLIQTAGAVGRAVMLPTVNTLAGAGSAALGAVCAMNANYTESKGTMGDGSNVYGLYHVFIKITRPATVDNSGNSLITIPSQYCHDYGRPCNKQLTLTAGDGYTQVMDANITGAMTDREKQMIIDGFRHGLIL